jgi:hypothetical protein
MTARTHTRPPLFALPDATWRNNNTAVWTDTIRVAREMAELLKSKGYTLMNATAIAPYLYRFEYIDAEGRNHGHAGGNNQFVDLYLRCDNMEQLMYEVAYRRNDIGPWRVYKTHPNAHDAWYGAHNAKYAEFLCRQEHPDATVVIRPTLYPR